MSSSGGPNPCQSPAADDPAALPPASGLWPLFILFGSLYFVQGIVEPTAGMIAQPVQSQLQNWGYAPKAITAMFALIGSSEIVGALRKPAPSA